MFCILSFVFCILISFFYVLGYVFLLFFCLKQNASE